MENNKIGFAVTGSFCTHSKIKNIISQMCTDGYDITPIVSFNTASMDSRFGKSSVFLSDIEDITKKKPIMSIQDAEKKIHHTLLIIRQDMAKMQKKMMQMENIIHSTAYQIMLYRVIQTI